MSGGSDLKKPVGIWHSIKALGGYRFTEVVWPEVSFAILIGVVGGVMVVRSTPIEDRVAVVGALLSVPVAFLAVVFAALAIVVALPASRYLDLLGDSPDGGMRRFLDPFLVAAGAQIALVLLMVSYRFLATHVPDSVEHVAFYAISFLFVFGVLDIGSLARQLVRHGIFRAADAADEAKRDQASVTRMERRR
jgi:uncharacterized membrane protein